MRYYIIAGEASGDLHASNLMKQILVLDPKAEFRFWGGERMQAVGGELVIHYKDIAFMGFIEVIRNLRTILKNISFCKKDILEFKPDALILVDYPGFNLRIAEWAKPKGLKVFYYISPQVWAWKQSRVHKINRSVDKLFAILSFEKDFYKKFNYDIDFVGHPLLDAIGNDLVEDPSVIRKRFNLGDGKIVLLLPGSRKQEIQAMLPVMLEAAKKDKEYKYVLAGVSSIPEDMYASILGNSGVQIVCGNTYGLLSVASAAMVTSGTATLETALFGVPEVVCYKGSKISYAIAKRLIKVKYISLVNLILDRVAVTELIQDEMNAERLSVELKKILSDDRTIAKMKMDYTELKSKLGGGGASKRTAEGIVNFLRHV
ncbi:MAG: lipid-A-disaccharide synthase [Bacteroidetes bacterium]|nr:lipid-A-disaccharide synthase [Bacteroidota bacterium]